MELRLAFQREGAGCITQASGHQSLLVNYSCMIMAGETAQTVAVVCEKSERDALLCRAHSR